MALDRSTAAVRGRLIIAGHTNRCAQYGCYPRCHRCYSRSPREWSKDERRPRTMEAAYAALPSKARALMARARRSA